MRERILLVVLLLALPMGVYAAPGLPALSVTTTGDGEQTYTVSMQVLLMMTALSLLPAALIMMTSFTRIIIVLAILRQALGTAQTPSSQILIGLSLFLTFFVMTPVLDRLYSEAFQPYVHEEATFQESLLKAKVPMRDFMLAQTRETDLALFTEIGGGEKFESPEQLPFSVLILTFFVMTPVFDRLYSEAFQPYVHEEATFQESLSRAKVPMRDFMLAQTRETDLALFTEIGGRRKVRVTRTVAILRIDSGLCHK